jgi:hypothetical protein
MFFESYKTDYIYFVCIKKKKNFKDKKLIIDNNIFSFILYFKSDIILDFIIHFTDNL